MPVPGLSLPKRLADFERRGFRRDRPEAREILEGAARAFIEGFDLAAATRRREVHAALASGLPEPLRGFGYEGAAMYAGLVDLASAGRSGRVAALAAGPGDAYVHLIHVGAGWSLAPMRSARLPRLPGRPLLRWLAYDGAGFGASFFGGESRLRFLCSGAGSRSGAGSPRRAVVRAGAGRALWFQQAADPDGVAHVIAAQPAATHADLWSGVGLAVAYAGAVDHAGRAALIAHAGRYHPDLAQGVLFGTAARQRSGVVPEHTHAAAAQIVGVTPEVAERWTDEESADLLGRHDIEAYLTWRRRLAARADRHAVGAGSGPGSVATAGVDLVSPGRSS